jgi:hypothetical protein
MSETMRVFKNDYETFVTPSFEELPRLFDATHGEGSWEEFGRGQEGDWREVPLDKMLTIEFDEDDDPRERTQTVLEWAQENGPGYLCGTES